MIYSNVLTPFAVNPELNVSASYISGSLVSSLPIVGTSLTHSSQIGWVGLMLNFLATSSRLILLTGGNRASNMRPLTLNDTIFLPLNFLYDSATFRLDP